MTGSRGWAYSVSTTQRQISNEQLPLCNSSIVSPPLKCFLTLLFQTGHIFRLTLSSAIGKVNGTLYRLISHKHKAFLRAMLPPSTTVCHMHGVHKAPAV